MCSNECVFFGLQPRTRKDSTENNTVESCIEHLKKKIREGPYHIYCVCNRTLNKDFFNIDYK